MASEEREALTDLITQAHEAMKDLRLLIKQAEIADGILRETARRAIDENIAELVEQGMSAYAEAISIAIDKSQDSIYARFDELTALMLGETKKAVRAGESVEDHITAVKRVLEDRGF